MRTHSRTEDETSQVLVLLLRASTAIRLCTRMFLKTHRDIPAWTRALADQRTGKVDQNARQAWRLLIDSIYVAPSVPGQCPLINIRPTFGKYRTYYANPRIKYTNRTLLEATELMLKADSKERAYEYDVANLTRQLLSNHFLTVFRKYEQAYNRRDRAQMSILQKDMMGQWVWAVTPVDATPRPGGTATIRRAA